MGIGQVSSYSISIQEGVHRLGWFSLGWRSVTQFLAVDPRSVEPTRGSRSRGPGMAYPVQTRSLPWPDHGIV